MSKSINSRIVSLTDGRTVLFSYNVAVAAYIPGQGYIALDHRFSVTTSKHVNQYTKGDARRFEASSFQREIAPVDPNFPAGVL